MDRGGQHTQAGDSAPPAHIASAWQTWLRALATDADAALATAHVYRSLSLEGRRAWIEATDREAEVAAHSPNAVYAPLLGVEEDAELQTMLRARLACETQPNLPMRAFRLVGAVSTWVALAVPVYGSFVELVEIELVPDTRVLRVAIEPLRDLAHADGAVELDSGTLSAVCATDAIEDLAHAIVAHKRSGHPFPEGTSRLTALLDLRHMQP